MTIAGLCRHTCTQVYTPGGTLAETLIKEHTHDSGNIVSCLLYSVFCGKSSLRVNTFELLNLLSNYRTVKRQAEGVLEGNACCVRGRKGVCVWLIMGRNMFEWRSASEREGKKEKCVSMCVRFIHICSVPNTGSAQWWPIVGRNDNRLYLALQTARELSAVSTRFLFFLPPFFLFFLCLFSVLILSVSLSLNGSSLLLSTPSLCHFLSLLYFILLSFLPFVPLFSVYSVSYLAARVLSSRSFSSWFSALSSFLYLALHWLGTQ